MGFFRWGIGMSAQNRGISWIIRGIGLLSGVLVFLPSDTSAWSPLQAAPLFIQVPNLVGYWCVDGLVPDSTTIARDSSGTGNPGTYNGGATAMAAAPAVPPGNLRSFSFNQASRQYISVPSSPSLNLTGSLTVAAWIRPTLDSTLQQGIVEKWDDAAGAANGFLLRLDANENLVFSTFPATGAAGEITTTPRHIPLNVWTHVAGVYSTAGGTMTNYVNAAADPSTAAGAPAPAAGSNPLQIGKDYASNAFNGNIDEVRIYNRALSAAEIAILKNGQPAPTALIAIGGTNQVQLTWTAPSNAGTTSVTYSVLRGPSSGTYDTVFNGINTTSYTDTSVSGGTAYYYAVVAVSVMASGPSNEESEMAAAGPPPVPAAPRTSKTGNEGHQMCGWSVASPDALSTGALGTMLAVSLLLTLVRRRTS